jgi:hypothetical protein
LPPLSGAVQAEATTCLAMSRPMLHRFARQPPDGVPASSQD